MRKNPPGKDIKRLRESLMAQKSQKSKFHWLVFFGRILILILCICWGGVSVYWTKLGQCCGLPRSRPCRARSPRGPSCRTSGGARRRRPCWWTPTLSSCRECGPPGRAWAIGWAPRGPRGSWGPRGSRGCTQELDMGLGLLELAASLAAAAMRARRV